MHPRACARQSHGTDTMTQRIDPATGKLVRTFGTNGRVDLRPGMGPLATSFSFTSMPQVCNDAVLIGAAMTDSPRNKEEPPGKVQAFDVYSSVWFSAIYILLFISLVGCVIPRTTHHIRALLQNLRKPLLQRTQSIAYPIHKIILVLSFAPFSKNLGAFARNVLRFIARSASR